MAEKWVEIDTKNFCELETKYNNKKYPEDVYERIILSVKHDKQLSVQSLREAIFWKYGKWQQFSKSKGCPPSLVKVINKMVQNLMEMNELFRSNIERDYKIEKMRQKLDQILGNGIVTKAWILHIYFPGFCRVIDQHTFRAMRYLSLGTFPNDPLKLKWINIPPRTWEDVREYERFFAKFKTHHSMTDRSLDKCLMAWGKDLKNRHKSEK